jgi:uncharacterized iron-regulated membrane protein
MGIAGSLLLIAIVGGGMYFAVWAIRRTLAEDTGKNRNQRRTSRRRR